MIVSASRGPSASSRVHPKVASACAFQVTIRPSESMPMNASCAVSTISRARASLSARRASAARRSSSAIATTIRLAVETAKFCSSTVHVRVPPTCSAHSTPIIRSSWRSGTSSMAPMPCGRRYDCMNSRVRGSVWASCAAITRSRSSASK